MAENDGILLIDKPTGMTSHDVVNIIRRQTGVKRVGHAGTLDPLATGLLIILVGRENTKHQDGFMKQAKEYEVTGELGVETDTYDSQGTVVRERPWAEVREVSEEDLKRVLVEFVGEIEQTVPAYSAIKVSGQKLYDQARRGTVDLESLPKRRVKVKSVELLKFEVDEAAQKTFFSLRVHCSSGTYIRSLVHDIGVKLGVGATVTALRRTKIGELSVEDAKQLPLNLKKRTTS